VAGTTYEAEHYAVFSSFLLLSAIKFYRLISTVPKPSLQSFTVTYKVSHPQVWKYCVNTHTCLLFNCHVIRMHKGEQNFMKLYCVLLQINFFSISLFCKSMFLTTAPKYFTLQTLPKFQTAYQLGHVCWRCDIPVVPLEFIVKEEMWPINAQLHCSNYKWQSHVLATKLPSSGCLCEKYKWKFYTCSLHMVKND